MSIRLLRQVGLKKGQVNLNKGIRPHKLTIYWSNLTHLEAHLSQVRIAVVGSKKSVKFKKEDGIELFGSLSLSHVQRNSEVTSKL